MAHTSSKQIAIAAVACGLIALALGYMWLNRPATYDAALRDAVSRGDLARAERLLRKGANPNLASTSGTVPVLEHALSFARTNKAELVALLLDHGADPNIMCDDTPLVVKAMQIESLSPEIVDLLVTAGADLNKQDAKGKTVLHYAVFPPGRADDRLLAALLKGGADPNIRDNDGRIAIECISQRREDALVLLIEAGSEFEFGKDLNISPLHYVIAGGNPKVAVSMIEKGADVNEEEKTGRTPLFSAAYYGPLNLVQTLVAQGADINHADRSGYTPLHSAAAGFQKDIAAYLIEQGAAPDARNSKGVTPLEYARNYSASRPGSVERKQATVRYLETCDVR